MEMMFTDELIAARLSIWMSTQKTSPYNLFKAAALKGCGPSAIFHVLVVSTTHGMPSRPHVEAVFTLLIIRILGAKLCALKDGSIEFDHIDMMSAARFVDRA